MGLVQRLADVLHLDVDQGSAVVAPPVVGEHTADRGVDVAVHLHHGRGQTQVGQAFNEDFRGEVLRIGTVPHPGEHEPVNLDHVGLVDRFPVAVQRALDHVDLR